jgi:hypothetical protein
VPNSTSLPVRTWENKAIANKKIESITQFERKGSCREVGA